ncbi:MAG: urea ABC transporter permease subunit UrtB [Planctomycetota bacterium]|jgi:urea transport system permease protein|nr:urea ABC transporter permease subunit UrtB [Planctomycetota bacterium]
MLRALPAIGALALLLLSPLAAPAGAGEQEGFALSGAALSALASSKVNDRSVAIAEMARDASPMAREILRALLEGRLYLDKAGGGVYLAGPDGGAPANAVSGPPAAGGPAGLKKITVNNGQRQEIARVLHTLALAGGEVQSRRAASAALLSDAGQGPAAPTLERLIADESDPEVLRNLRAALGLLLARAGDASRTAELETAIDYLAASGQPSTRAALAGLAASTNPQVAKKAADALYWAHVALDWAAFTETMFFGLSLGSILALTAIGLAITFGVMGVINMAHGELIMIGAYTAWGMQQLLPNHLSLALALSIPAAFAVSGGIGAILEIGVIRFLYGRPLETLLATFGISLILQQTVRSLISSQNRAVDNPGFMSGMWRITENFSVTCNRFYILVFCLAVFAAIFAAMHWTRLGLEVRAVSQNRSIARAMGVRDSRVDALTFGLGSGIAGMAGVALSQITNVGPNLGQAYIVDSFMVVVFGGVGNLWGTMIGGLLLGVANKALEPVSGAMLAKIFILVLIILFIQKRPRGLFPQRGRAAEG